ncbi:MAG TPA: hypothetical protein PLD59_09240 [Tepidisphaeraceae bacterium]|nr:hypothetical protein [Tepidisphaeraceae bacterium]
MTTSIKPAQKNSRRFASTAAAMCLLHASLAAASLPAFPGAQGPGANATGGRGGDVYHVTRLDFDLNGVIPGSLKYGINNAPAAGRTIVFDVGGTIYQNGGGANAWFRSGKSNITIAGQTAPGAGITIAGVGTKWTGNNVILRNITARPNKDPINPTSFTYDAFALQLTNSVVDHVAGTWFSDEGISLTDAGNNTTVQYSKMSEGLNYDSHSFGSIIATEVDGAHYAYHHNLYAQNGSRMPRLGSATGSIGAETEFSNNVIYNWINRAGYSGTNQNSSTNFINNYFIKGNNNGATLFTGGDAATAPGYTKIFQSGNVYDGNKDGTFNGTVVGAGSFAGNKTIVGAPFAINGVGAVDSPAIALQSVLDHGGANWQNRNPIDQRIINAVRSGTEEIIADLTTGQQVAEWATVLSQRADAGGNAPFNRPVNFDTDQDGMPDAWEISLGLNPLVANNNGDFDNDGYTDLEEYINELAAWPATKPLVWNGSHGRYALQSNWTANWQPSRYDAVHINSGTATIDAVGQAAGTLQIAAGATVRLTAGTNITQKVLAIASSGRLDLADNALIVDYASISPLDSIKEQILSARNGGAWDGNGITSTLADASAFTLGHGEASLILGLNAGEFGLFRGQTVDATAILVLFTRYGDATLDRAVNLDDFTALAASFGQSATWSGGDFDGNGMVTLNDFTILAANFGLTGPAESPARAVPEPAVSLPASALILASLRRRR